tara:strand:- start:2536 stop:3117 length:582 start_codon:yes stop_codon:yes gene_type:complete
MQLQGKEIDFREPSLLYDTIPVFDKSRQQYLPRKRSTAISYSDSGEIILTMTVCSEKDTFTKAIAYKILQGRMKKALVQYLGTAEPTYSASYVEGTYIFTDSESFNQFCNTMDAMGRQFFAPYNVQYASRITNNPEYIRLEAFSDIYLHRVFIQKTWSEFAEELMSSGEVHDTLTYDDESTEERDSNETISAG